MLLYIMTVALFFSYLCARAGFWVDTEMVTEKAAQALIGGESWLKDF